MFKVSGMYFGVTKGEHNQGRNNACRGYGQQFSKTDKKQTQVQTIPVQENCLKLCLATHDKIIENPKWAMFFKQLEKRYSV